VRLLSDSMQREKYNDFFIEYFVPYHNILIFRKQALPHFSLYISLPPIFNVYNVEIDKNSGMCSLVLLYNVFPPFSFSSLSISHFPRVFSLFTLAFSPFSRVNSPLVH
jgi:hypothetical protein